MTIEEAPCSLEVFAGEANGRSWLLKDEDVHLNNGLSVTRNGISFIAVHGAKYSLRTSSVQNMQLPRNRTTHLQNPTLVEFATELPGTKRRFGRRVT